MCIMVISLHKSDNVQTSHVYNVQNMQCIHVYLNTCTWLKRVILETILLTTINKYTGVSK